MSDKNENATTNNTIYDKKLGSDMYQIAWSGSMSSLLGNVQKLRRSNILCDCKLVASGRTFFAHKVVLSAASTLLKNLLQDEKSDQSTIILAGVSADDLAALLEYIYNGLVKVSLKQLSALLMVAHSLGISSLTTYQIKTENQLTELNSVEIPSMEIDVDMQGTLTHQQTAYRIETEVEPIISDMLDQIVSTKNTSNSSSPINGMRFGSPIIDKIGSNKRTYCPSESPAMCPYCHVVIKQGRNMTRHLSLKHNVISKTKKIIKATKASDQPNGLPHALQMLETIEREETVSSMETEAKYLKKE